MGQCSLFRLGEHDAFMCASEHVGLCDGVGVSLWSGMLLWDGLSLWSIDDFYVCCWVWWQGNKQK